MSINLASVLAKLGRAHEHAKAVKDEVRAWKDSSPYLITREVNADSTRYSLIAHIGIEPPLQRWTLMVGDVIHNLRCALDHLVYAIAIHEANGQEPPPNHRNLAFPLCDVPERFTEAAGRIKTLGDPVTTAIEACQPYNRRHATLPPVLSILNLLENTDKHQLLRLAFAATVHGKVGFVGEAPLGTVVKVFANSGEIKNGTEIVAYTVDRPAPNMKFDRYDFLTVVALWHGKRDPSGPDGSDRTDFPSLLTLLTKEVRDVIDVVCAAVK